MEIERFSVERAVEQAKRMPFAMLRTAEQVTLGKNPVQWDVDKLDRAYFFDETTEIRFFRDDNGFHAVKVRTEPKDIKLEELRDIRDSKFGKKLRVRKILGYDEDGQAYVKATVLCGWED